MNRETPIAGAPLSVRAKRGLTSAGLKTVGDILDLGADGQASLLRDQAIGPKTADEIVKLAEDYASQRTSLRIELGESAGRLLIEATRLRRIADGQRGPEWRLTNSIISAVEVQAMALRGLTRARSPAEAAVGVPAFSRQQLAEMTD